MKSIPSKEKQEGVEKPRKRKGRGEELDRGAGGMRKSRRKREVKRVGGAG